MIYGRSRRHHETSLSAATRKRGTLDGAARASTSTRRCTSRRCRVVAPTPNRRISGLRSCVGRSRRPRRRAPGHVGGDVEEGEHSTPPRAQGSEGTCSTGPSPKSLGSVRRASRTATSWAGRPAVVALEITHGSGPAPPTRRWRVPPRTSRAARWSEAVEAERRGSCCRHGQGGVASSSSSLPRARRCRWDRAFVAVKPTKSDRGRDVGGRGALLRGVDHQIAPARGASAIQRTGGR